MKNSKTRSRSDQKMRSAIAACLAEEGIPAERKGYAYLACAIRLVCEDSRLSGALSKELYPAVAERFDTSPGAVERAMRTAIACAGRRRQQTLIDEGPEKGGSRKTNSAFIFETAEKVKMILEK